MIAHAFLRLYFFTICGLDLNVRLGYDNVWKYFSATLSLKMSSPVSRVALNGLWVCIRLFIVCILVHTYPCNGFYCYRRKCCNIKYHHTTLCAYDAIKEIFYKSNSNHSGIEIETHASHEQNQTIFYFLYGLQIYCSTRT